MPSGGGGGGEMARWRDGEMAMLDARITDNACITNDNEVNEESETMVITCAGGTSLEEVWRG